MDDNVFEKSKIILRCSVNNSHLESVMNLKVHQEGFAWGLTPQCLGDYMVQENWEVWLHSSLLCFIPGNRRFPELDPESSFLSWNLKVGLSYINTFASLVLLKYCEDILLYRFHFIIYLVTVYKGSLCIELCNYTCTDVL